MLQYLFVLDILLSSCEKIIQIEKIDSLFELQFNQVKCLVEV